MPLYEYACTSCDHHFDVRHSADERPALSCPQCQSDVKKVFHAAGIIFKGGGWHIKDYAAKSSGSAGTEAKESSSTAVKESSSTPENKQTPAAPATPAST